MYFFGIWIFKRNSFEFNSEFFPIFKSDLSEKEWQKRLSQISYSGDNWRFYYTKDQEKIIDAWQFGISTTRYFTEQFAKDAAFVEFNRYLKRVKRMNKRASSKRKRIRDKEN